MSYKIEVIEPEYCGVFGEKKFFRDIKEYVEHHKKQIEEFEKNYNNKEYPDIRSAEKDVENFGDYDIRARVVSELDYYQKKGIPGVETGKIIELPAGINELDIIFFNMGEEWNWPETLIIAKLRKI